MKFLRIFKLYFSILPKLKNKEIFFFFPSIHMGGAETVHGDILKIFKDKKTVCLITGFSSNEFNKERFNSYSVILNIYKLVKINFLKKIVLEKISKKINLSKNTVVFGCNSHFFYDLIPLLNNNVKVIDLIHAFSYEQETALEKYSLNRVQDIDFRIVLGNKTKSDFEELYKLNSINLKFLERIIIIKNKVDFTSFNLEEKTHNPIKILFVGRDSEEKRPKIFYEIAKKIYSINKEIRFQMIGDDFINYKNTANLEIIGAIRDKQILNSYYKNATIILITSTREGFPMVVLEAMAFGVIPICTNVGEISEIINNINNNGFIIENGDELNIVNDFISKIKLLIKDKEKISIMKKNAFNSIKNDFSEELNTLKYQELFSTKS